MVLNRCTNMINFKQNYLKKLIIEKNTGRDKLRSRFTLSAALVFPTPAVLHPNLRQPHQLCGHRGGWSIVTVLPLLYSVQLQPGTHHPLVWGVGGSASLGSRNWGRKYLLYLLFDLVFWFPNSFRVLLFKKFRQTHGVLPNSPWVRTKISLWMQQTLDLGLLPGGSGVENLPAM